VELLLQSNANIRHKNQQKNTPLHLAIFGGNVNIVKMLLSCGANPNEPGMQGKTPLHLAYTSNAQPIIEVLLQHGSDPTIKDEQGKIPRDYHTDGRILPLESSQPLVRLTFEKISKRVIDQMPADMAKQLEKQQVFDVPPQLALRLVEGSAKLVFEGNSCRVQ